MTLDEAYKLKGLATTQVEIWTARIREANLVISQNMQKVAAPKMLQPVVPATTPNGDTPEEPDQIENVV